jgi:hypothetical protein
MESDGFFRVQISDHHPRLNDTCVRAISIQGSVTGRIEVKILDRMLDRCERAPIRTIIDASDAVIEHPARMSLAFVLMREIDRAEPPAFVIGLDAAVQEWMLRAMHRRPRSPSPIFL